jgi:predicted phage terminase large subunit-like protein
VSASLNLTPASLQKLKNALPTMPEKEKRRTLELLQQYQTEKTKLRGKSSFLDFIHHVYPNYIVGPHHQRLARIFEEIAAGKKKRVIVNIAPRHGKSEMISYLAPAWFLGNYPHKKVIMASHTADLAVNFGRRVRNLVGSDPYHDIFPQVELQADSKSASRWGTNFNGEYFAIGVGGALAGRGADLFIIDDPHSEQEAMQGRADVFEPAWEWFQSGPLQRLMPGGAIIIVMCMTGDTPVLMADGTELPLRDVHPGWMIASYENGRLITKRVMNHQSSGVDQVFTVQTQSGRMLRANERHPFLVEQNGEQQWVRLRDLKPGMSLVALKGAADQHGHRLDPACATPAKPERRTTASILMRLMSRLDITDGGEIPSAQGAAAVQSSPRDSALSATASSTRRPSRLPHSVAHDASSPATGSRLKSMAEWLRNAATAVMSAGNVHPVKTHALIGAGNSASTIATIQARYEDSYATTVTSRSDTARPPRSCAAPLDTSDFTLDTIVSITPSGREEVFDIQVQDTENFIANGVVAHNTRWSKLDLTGQVIDHMTRNTGTDDWEVVEFPALLNDKPLWPDFWSIEELLSKRAGMDPRYWQAQYMQDPVSEEGALIKNEWWLIWEDESPPQCSFIIMSLDAAQETNNRADYNALQVWGVFYNEESKSYQIILLNAIKQRLEFPDLKSLCIEEYKEWKPDSFIVEKKSNGAALYQELRRMGIPVSEFTPGKGQDKISRVNSVTDLFRSGFVWTPDRRWAQEVMDECQDFPSGRNDDQVDAMTLALMRFRQGGFVRLPSDEPEPIQMFKSKRRQGYY